MNGGMDKIDDLAFFPGEMDLSDVRRFHWQGSTRLGDEKALEICRKENENFETEFLRTILESLLTSTTITSLDLRGNGLDKADCLLGSGSCWATERLVLYLLTTRLGLCEQWKVVVVCWRNSPRPRADLFYCSSTHSTSRERGR